MATWAGVSGHVSRAADGRRIANGRAPGALASRRGLG